MAKRILDRIFAEIDIADEATVEVSKINPAYRGQCRAGVYSNDIKAKRYLIILGFFENAEIFFKGKLKKISKFVARSQ